MRVRRHRAWPVLVGLLLFFLAGGALAAYQYALGAITAKITAVATARGLALDWGTLALGLDGEISLTAVQFHGLGEGELSGTVDRVSAHIELDDLWSRRRPTLFRVEGVALQADRRGLVSLRSGANQPEGSADPQQRRPLTFEVVGAQILLRDGLRSAACQVSEMWVEVRPALRVEGAVDCRLPDLGVDTGVARIGIERFTDDSWLFQIQPEDRIVVSEYSASMGAVAAAVEADMIRVSVDLLSLSPDMERLGLGGGAFDADFDSVLVEFSRSPDTPWDVSRLQAGPGEVKLVLASRSDGEGAARSEIDGATLAELAEEAEARSPRGYEDEVYVPVALDWEALKATLDGLTASAESTLGRVGDLVGALEVSDVSIWIQRGDATYPLAIRTLEIEGGELAFVAEVGDQPISAHLLHRAAPDGHQRLELDIRAPGIDVGQISNAIGREGLLAGHLDAEIHLVSNDQWTLDLSLESPDLVFRHDAVSPLPLAFEPIQVDLEARLITNEANEDEEAPGLFLEMSGRLGDLVSGAATFTLTNEDDATTIDVRFEVEETDCASLLEAVPEGLFEHLDRDRIEVEGYAGVDGTMRYALGNPRSFRLRFGDLFPGTCQILEMPQAFQPERLLSDGYVFEVPEAYTSEGVQLEVGPGTDGYVPIETLPEYIPAIMYISEQRLFYEEPAISVRLINRAVRVNLIYGRWVYGGSTITQQLVKNLYFDRTKTLARKLEEALVAWAVHTTVEPDRILELYINCIEFARDVWGIEAAAQYYFGLHAAELSPIQAVYLAGLKPAPSSGASHLSRGSTPERERWRNRLRDRLTQLAELGFIDYAYVEAQHPYVIPLGEAAIEARAAAAHRVEIF